MKTELTLKSYFSCAHLYKQNSFSVEENSSTFGKCFSTYGHGHNYKLEVTYLLESNNSTEIKKRENFSKQIVQELDHHHLNFMIKEFKMESSNPNLIPTTENIALWILNRLNKETEKPTRLRLYEMDDLYVEIIQ